MNHGYYEDYLADGHPEEWLHMRCRMLGARKWAGPGHASMKSFRHHDKSYDIWVLCVAPSEYRFFDTKKECESACVLRGIDIRTKTYRPASRKMDIKGF